MAMLTATGFEKLLAQLGESPAEAAEGYEELRQKLVQCFIWRGCLASDADVLADQTLDRIAAKLIKGVEIENLNAYAVAVSRFVWLEYGRKNKEDAVGDEIPEQSYQPEFADEPDERLKCLRKCLTEITADDSERQLIIGYYERDAGVKIKEQRKSLAEKLGMTVNNLKVKACRLRSRLESCIKDCVTESL